MKIRHTLLMLIICLFAVKGYSTMAVLPGNFPAQQMEATAGKMKEKGDHKLSFAEKVMVKLAKKKLQKMEKKMNDRSSSAPGIEKGVYIIVAILIPFLAVGLATNFEGNDWLICLLLTILFYLPGLIYALIKMKDYYG